MFCWAALCLVYATLAAIAVGRVVRGVPLLATASPEEPLVWSRVSLIVTARDEQASLEDAMKSKLRVDYPNVELVVVDDRSQDATGAIIDQLAARDERVVPVHIHTLPDGWLGKLNALDKACARATGDWILFSDADVHLAPSTLRKAVAYCEEHALDHLCVFPEVWPSALALDATMNAFLRVMVVLSRPCAVADPDSRVSAGGGNFNLVRRAMLDRTAGFESLRLEVIDDAALGQMLKRAGAAREW